MTRKRTKLRPRDVRVGRRLEEPAIAPNPQEVGTLGAGRAVLPPMTTAMNINANPAIMKLGRAMLPEKVTAKRQG